MFAQYFLYYLFCFLSLLTLLLILRGVWVYFYWKSKKVSCFLKHSLVSNLNLFTLRLSIVNCINELYELTTDNAPIGFHVLWKKCILIKDPKLIKRIMIKDFDHFQNRTMAVNYDGDALGTKTLFVSKNPIWRTNRINLSPAFKTSSLKLLFNDISNTAENFCDYIRENVGEKLNANEICIKYSTDIVTNSLCGLNANSFIDEDSELRKVTKGFIEGTLFRAIQASSYFLCPELVKVFNMKWLDPPAGRFLENLFWEMKKEREMSFSTKKDYMDTLFGLIDSKKFYHDSNDVIAQLPQVYIAGIDTVGITMCYALYELAANPEIQTKLRDEIVRVTGSKDDVTYDNLRDMSYMDLVYKETLRRHTAFPMLDRETLKDYKDPESDLIIERGTNVYVDVRGVHLDPNNYVDPLRFYPERFLDANINDAPFLPFGLGPRSCLGNRHARLSFFLAMTKILSRYKIVAVDKNDLKVDKKYLLLTAKNTIYVKFQPI